MLSGLWHKAGLPDYLFRIHMPFPRLVGTALLCAGLLALAACASKPQHPNGPTPPGGLRASFKKADLNGDEQLTREEMTAGLPQYAEHFDEIDTDHNGLVNLAELLSYAQWRRLEAEDAAEQRQYSQQHNRH
jgi:hypothetical protein